MIRFGTRRATAVRTGLAVAALTSATVLAGCGAGQVSQVATQAPAINGTEASVGTDPQIVLRNVHLQAVQTGDQIKPGTDVALKFAAVNDSITGTDKLTGITSEVGPVEITRATLPISIGPGESLMVGDPHGAKELGTIEELKSAYARVTLDKPISNGLKYNFTFSFAKAGDVTVSVPISAGLAPRQSVGSDSGH